jgi:hypothetical protein
LFTAFSLKLSSDEGPEPEVLLVVRRWKREFSGVAVEEMFHLAIVTNLLNATVAPPTTTGLISPRLLVLPARVSDRAAWLRPGHAAALHRDEQPDGSNLSAARSSVAARARRRRPRQRDRPDPLQFDSQGDVYTAVDAGLRDMAARLGEADVSSDRRLTLLFVASSSRTAGRQ